MIKCFYCDKKNNEQEVHVLSIGSSLFGLCKKCNEKLDEGGYVIRKKVIFGTEPSDYYPGDEGLENHEDIKENEKNNDLMKSVREVTERY